MYFVASVVDEPLWPVELNDSQLALHLIYQVPIIVIAGRSYTLFIIYYTFVLASYWTIQYSAYLLVVKNIQQLKTTHDQETSRQNKSRAIAGTTARCAQYMSAQIIM